MTRSLQVTTLLCLGLAAFALSGPRARVADPPELAPPMVPAELAALPAWLAAGEDTVPSLKRLARKEIVWADPEHPARTPVALVYLHGYSATRVETAPLADSVAAELGANLFYTRLSGHGRDGAAMADARVGDWLEDVREALAVARRLGERTVILGTSTGATLALWAAADAPERHDLAALVLISPNFAPADARSRVLLWPWGSTIARLVNGAEYSWEPANDAQAAGWTTRYPTRALPTMMALVDWVTQPERLARVQVPTLTLYSPNDEVIDVAALRSGIDALGAPVRERIEITSSTAPSQHVIAGDILSPTTTLELARHITEFVRRQLPEVRSPRAADDAASPAPMPTRD